MGTKSTGLSPDILQNGFHCFCGQISSIQDKCAVSCYAFGPAAIPVCCNNKFQPLGIGVGIGLIVIVFLDISVAARLVVLIQIVCVFQCEVGALRRPGIKRITEHSRIAAVLVCDGIEQIGIRHIGKMCIRDNLWTISPASAIPPDIKTALFGGRFFYAFENL